MPKPKLEGGRCLIIIGTEGDRQEISTPTDADKQIDIGWPPLCANDVETPAPFEFRLGHRRMTSWLCPTQMAQSN